MLVFIYRTIKFALQGFFRNIWLSLVTIIILVLALFSITLVAGVNMVAKQAIVSVQDKVDVSVYFKPTANEPDILNVRYRLEGLATVKSVSYTSQDEALEKFKAAHADNPRIIESLAQLESNPLGATLIIKAKNINDYPQIMTLLDSPDYQALIQDKNFDDNEKVINRLNSLSDKIQHIGIVVSIIFIIIAILIIFNTIRINIYTHREEIGIMKLVGASNWFIRAPFLVESFLYAGLAVVFCVVIMYPLLGLVAPQLNNFFEGNNVDLVRYFWTNIWKIVGLQFAFAVVLSVFSSGIAIGKYMKV
jgi:cell division transport system permease protein